MVAVSGKGVGGGRGCMGEERKTDAIPARATKRKRIKENKPQTCRLGESFGVYSRLELSHKILKIAQVIGIIEDVSLWMTNHSEANKSTNPPQLKQRDYSEWKIQHKSLL